MMPVISTKWNCGCVARTSVTHNRVYIDYCPQHAAGPALYKALKGLRDYEAASWEADGFGNRPEVVEEAVAALKLVEDEDVKSSI